jgi:hypothetical protein
MGHDQQSATIYAYVSRHNSENDERDDALWDRLKEEVAVVLAKPVYEPIRPSF